MINNNIIIIIIIKIHISMVLNEFVKTQYQEDIKLQLRETVFYHICRRGEESSTFDAPRSIGESLFTIFASLA